MCVRVREHERVCGRACVCGGVCERARERECVCVCVCVCLRVQAHTYGADVCIHVCVRGGKLVSGIVKGAYGYN